MEGKPFHFDGSQHNASGSTSGIEPFELTEEMRKSISGNPFQAVAAEESEE
ncbi:hypothetical protein LCM10_11635 [Rossellomorea aquimaris]|uniref:hypothetical protein n=1 Tax=Rossellomorea aquimaris TaxID=189382 RepID=UPI001CD43C01|nr:hypothetical protein [Rossellomorea aquimaris]MCA1055637.1 hypothetical protein [Rossellomorea aquimaris]